jgi:hypothetical protein
MPIDLLSLNASLNQVVPRMAVFSNQRFENTKKVLDVFEHMTISQEELHHRVFRVTTRLDRMVRCAGPTIEPINQQYGPPELASCLNLVATDGSCLPPEPHIGYEFGVLNTAVVKWTLTEKLELPPEIQVETTLFVEDALSDGDFDLPDASSLELIRDIAERRLLAENAIYNDGTPCAAIVDGPLELYGSRPTLDGLYQSGLRQVQDAYQTMAKSQILCCGYVDSPRSNLLVRMLEIAYLPEEELPSVRHITPFRGVKDVDLLNSILQPGHRTAVFSLLSRSKARFSGVLEIHFFYLNVGDAAHPHFTRIEIPAWLANDNNRLNMLHATILANARLIPNAWYPLILIRADESARLDPRTRDLIQSLIISRRGSASAPSPKGQSKRLTGLRI